MANERVDLELRSLNNLIRRYFDLYSHKGEIESLTCNNGWIIGYLADRGDAAVFQKDIEDRFSITRSTASRVLSLMEQKGFICREAVSQDARLKKIALTDKAWKIREIMLEDGQKLEQRLLSGFSADEEQTLRLYLKRMKKNISACQENEGSGLSD